MAAPILSYEDLGLIQGEGWLFRELDLYIGERDRLGRAESMTLMTSASLPSSTLTKASAPSSPAPASCCSNRTRR